MELLLREWNIPQDIIANFNEDHTDQIIFLKNNNEPWSEIIDCWSKTFEVRQCSTNNNVSDFINEWNILNDPRSDSLINLDFERLYPERSTCFFRNWKWFINKIISLKFGESKDDTLMTLYESIQEQSDDDLKVPDQIKLLPYLIPPRGRLNKRTKFSTLECVENFIIDVQNPGDIQTKIGEVKEKALRSKQSVQPYLYLYLYAQSIAENLDIPCDITVQYFNKIKQFCLHFRKRQQIRDVWCYLIILCFYLIDTTLNQHV